MSYKSVKIIFYRTARALGLFKLSSLLFRKRLRILCYHGVSIADEHLWNPPLFIHPETLKRRFEALSRIGFPVLSLDEAIARFQGRTLPPNATVITFDDGFYNNYALARPLLEKFDLPYTIYTSSYYVKKQTPVFRLAIQYMLWKTRVARIDLSGFHSELASLGEVNLDDPMSKQGFQKTLIEFGETKLSDPERGELLRTLARFLDVDFESIESRRLLSFMNDDELRAIDASKLGAIELHTHRHLHMESPERAAIEIRDNRAALEPILGRPLFHFCYPSGVWSNDLWPTLERSSIRSATTCVSELNNYDTHCLGLGRFLDGENISEIEFEAEMMGFSELLRGLRRFARRRERASYGT